MCFIETYFSNSGGVINSLLNFLSGHSWAHIWYLYMLIGLYLITPVIKSFTVNASDKELLMALGVLFVLSSLFPTLNSMGAKIESYMIIYTPYIFIYMLGYWACWRTPQRILANKTLLLAVVFVCLIVTITKCYYDCYFYGYADPVVICLAAALFLLFKSLKVNWKLADKLAPYCFGVYLVHTIFINFAYKFLQIDEETVVPILNFISFFLLFSLLSVCCAWVMMQIPFLKKHVL